MHLIYNRNRDPLLIRRILSKADYFDRFYLWGNPPGKIKCFENPFNLPYTKHSEHLDLWVPGYVYADVPACHSVIVRYKPKKEGLCYNTGDWIY